MKLSHILVVILSLLGSSVAQWQGSFTGAVGYQVPQFFTNQVFGIVTDANNNKFVSDTNKNIIWRIDATAKDLFGNPLTTAYAGLGVVGTAPGDTGDGGPATSANIIQIFGVAIGPDGNLYIGAGCSIRMVDHTTKLISKTAGQETGVGGNFQCGSSGDGGAATSAYMRGVPAIAFKGGDLYLTDSQNCSVRRVNHTTGKISTVVGSTCTYNGALGMGGAATSAQLGYTNGIAFDGSGNMYISDQVNEDVYKVLASSDGGATWGNISLFAGNNLYPDNTQSHGWGNNCVPQWGTNGGDGGAATSAQLCQPADIRFDSAGNLYIDDFGYSRIRKVNTSGVISTYAGTGTGDPGATCTGSLACTGGSGHSSYSCTGDGSAATSAGLGISFGMNFDTSGNLFIVIAQCANNPNVDGEIRVVNSGTGIISKFSMGSS